ncbi:hypothetical protein [Chromobacterium amazonense]|uniref:Chromosome partitioning protein ParA n=1 Tax=Chromobacterium amazonense TaxID=1382803 RepID=A0ABU8UXA9_9NEIS|nr:hypothetical protein [Chromobacterium amazonense]MDQ4539181.1 hypothetical protein [Chromobacterium amazonense]
MNRIVIVGHPASGYQEVEHTLHKCGMQPAQPSRREGLSPQDITTTLRKVHGIASPDEAAQENDIAQVEAGPLWHGMAMDLMLGNLDQPLWGWSDPHAITTLNYWSELDPRLTFVLVYDEPHRVLMNASAQPQPPSGQNVQQLLDNWVAYNGALLHFYLRHRNRCLLVHAQQVRRAANRYVQQLQPMLDAALNQLPEHEHEHAGLPMRAHTEPTGIALLPTTRLSAIAELTGLDSGLIQHTLQATDTERYLLDDILRTTHPLSLQRYEELQASASLPLDPPMHSPSQASAAWAAWTQQRALTANLANRLHGAYQQLSGQLDDALLENSLQIKQHNIQLTQLQNQLRQSLSEREQQIQLSHKEDELLLNQLHQVQEELERYYQHKQELEQRNAEQTKELQRYAELVDKKEAEARKQLDTEKAASAKALAEARKQIEAAKTAVQHNPSSQGQQLKELLEENAVLLSQLHQTQEELERYYLRKQELEQRNAEQTKELQRYAELVGKKGADARKQLEAAKTAVQHNPSSQGPQLKALGKENAVLLSQLHQAQEELARYYLDTQPLEKQQAPANKPAMYGAAERVKQQLSYRLGAVMIARSHSLTGWLGMPWALAAEIRAFRQHRAVSSIEKLPPIHTYRDANQAERVKRHLSYRLGQTLLRHGRSPLGWAKLPFALGWEVRQFRLQRRES